VHSRQRRRLAAAITKRAKKTLRKDEDVDFSAFSAILAVKRFTLIGRLMSSAAIFR